MAACKDWFFFFVFSCLVVFVALSSTSCTAADPLLGELIAKRKASPDAVIRLSDADFDKFAKNKERKYALVVFFDAAMMHDNSEIKLLEMRKEYGFVAVAHMVYNAGQESGNTVFFTEVELKESPKVYQRFEVKSLPHVEIVLSAAEASKGRKSIPMPLGEVDRSAEGFAEWLKSALPGIILGPIQRPPMFSNAELAVMGAVAVASLPFILPRLLRHYAIISCVGGLIIYFFSVSGGMFNIIRGMPLYAGDRNDPKKFNYFYQSSGGQFGAEGFSAGAAFSSVGLILAIATRIVPHVKSRWIQRLLLAASMAGSYYAITWIVSLENWKSGYSIHGYWPKSWR